MSIDLKIFSEIPTQSEIDSKFKEIINSGNIDLLHSFLLDIGKINFNTDDYVAKLILFVCKHYNYGSNFRDVLYVTTSAYISNIFVTLMEKNYSDSINVLKVSKNDWYVIYDELFSPIIETNKNKAYEAELDEFNSKVIKGHFFQIASKLKTSCNKVTNDYSISPFNAFLILIRETLFNSNSFRSL